MGHFYDFPSFFNVFINHVNNHEYSKLDNLCIREHVMKGLCVSFNRVPGVLTTEI